MVHVRPESVPFLYILYKCIIIMSWATFVITLHSTMYIHVYMYGCLHCGNLIFQRAYPPHTLSDWASEAGPPVKLISYFVYIVVRSPCNAQMSHLKFKGHKRNVA